MLTVFFPLVAGCGVKSDPQPPADTLLPSVEEKFLIELKPESKKDNQKDKKKKKTSSTDGQ